MDVYSEFRKMALASRISADISEKQMVKDMLEIAYEYTGSRMMWNFLSIEEKAEQDRQRTLRHDRVLRSFKDYVMYKFDKDEAAEEFVKAFFELERKELGDFANRLVCDFALEMR